LITLNDRPPAQQATLSYRELPEPVIENLSPSRQDKKRHGTTPACSRHCRARLSLALGLNNRGFTFTFTDRRFAFAGATSDAQGENGRADYD